MLKSLTRASPQFRRFVQINQQVAALMAAYYTVCGFLCTPQSPSGYTVRQPVIFLEGLIVLARILMYCSFTC